MLAVRCPHHILAFWKLRIKKLESLIYSKAPAIGEGPVWSSSPHCKVLLPTFTRTSLVRIHPWSCWVFLLFTTQSSSILFNNHRLNLVMCLHSPQCWGVRVRLVERTEASEQPDSTVHIQILLPTVGSWPRYNLVVKPRSSSGIWGWLSHHPEGLQ